MNVEWLALLRKAVAYFVGDLATLNLHLYSAECQMKLYVVYLSDILNRLLNTNPFRNEWVILFDTISLFFHYI